MKTNSSYNIFNSNDAYSIISKENAREPSNLQSLRKSSTRKYIWMMLRYSPKINKGEILEQTMRIYNLEKGRTYRTEKCNMLIYMDEIKIFIKN